MADLSVTAANVGIKADTVTILQGQAGEGLTQGQSAYLKSSDNKYWKADNNVDAATAAAVGIVLTQAATDEYVVLATGGDIDIGAAVVVGTEYHVSATAGGVTADALTTGQYYTRIGYGSTTSTLTIDIKATGKTAA